MVAPRWTHGLTGPARRIGSWIEIAEYFRLGDQETWYEYEDEDE